MTRMRTVYVVTTAPSSRAQRARFLALRVLAGIVIWLMVVGQILLLALGALDSLITATIGTPRIVYCSRRLTDVIRRTWKEEL